MRSTIGFSLFLLISTIARAAEDPRLVEAAKANDLVQVQSLLKAGASPNSIAPDGSTALHWAAHRDNLPMLDALLAAGAKPDLATRYKVVPLTLAAQNGNAQAIEHLIKAGANPDAVSEEDDSALMTAARNGSIDAVRALLRAGANVNRAESFKGQTALMFAAGEGNVQAAELLIEFGADRKARSKAGYSPLLFAVRNNQLDAVKFLLSKGGDPNDKVADGTAALSISILNADFDISSVLLDAGANPNTPDSRGYPLHVVVWLHRPGAPPDFAMSGVDPQPVPRPSGKLDHIDILKKLLAKGADPNVEITFTEGRFVPGGGLSRNPPALQIGRHYLSYTGATPFYLAARNGDVEMMRILAQNGADPKKTTKHGVTPLMGAACLDYYEGETAGPYSGTSEAERLEAVKLALQLGNDINARTTFGDYPMIGTVKDTLLRYPDNINELLNLNVGDMRFDKMTALHGAVICNQPSIVEYLISQGAQVDAKNRLGWTPLDVAGGLYIANNRKDFPLAAEILKKARAAKGQPAQ